ncbi:18S rRNA (guanine1575-N7)-methyltransferase [Enteropsectra breve]|nr:18S rRNA (guanine1575-N7)-methyltransferase [Enteropsectra breve]
MTVPELSGPAELYYNESESSKYHKNSRIIKIQADITARALELLDVKEEHAVILDLGCGSGLSGKTINEFGHEWVGIDISESMLVIAQRETASLGLICSDIGERIPLRDNAVDYAISISAVQWLFQSYKKEHYPIQRIKCLFKNLHRIVNSGAVLQFYCNKKETEILKKEAVNAGFYGGLVTDAEGTKNEKMYLVLSKTRTPNKEQREQDDYRNKRKSMPSDRKKFIKRTGKK